MNKRLMFSAALMMVLLSANAHDGAAFGKRSEKSVKLSYI